MLSRWIAQLLGVAGAETRRRWARRWAVLAPLGFLAVPLSMASFLQVAVTRTLDWPLVYWAWPWLTAFVLVVVLDYAVGEYAGTPFEERPEALRAWRPLLHALPLLALPAHAAIVVLGARLAAGNPNLGIAECAAWMLSCGLSGGFHAGIAAHELIHRPSRWERAAGGFLLALIGYGTFKVEHVRGHHVDVGTPADASSAPRGLGIYRFLPGAVARNVARAWQLERERLARFGRSPWSPRNEVLIWSSVSLALAVGLGVAWGPVAVTLYVVQAAVGIWVLESANYIEHYGLRRRRKPDGRYERVGPEHSWDVTYLVSSWLMINLPRHARHHLRAGVPYYRLDAAPGAPRLPGGYTAMVLLAHVPPLWRRVVDPRIPDPGANGDAAAAASGAAPAPRASPGR